MLRRGLFSDPVVVSVLSTYVDITKTLGAQRIVSESYVSLVMCFIGCVRSSLERIDYWR